jgi:hypothetical protein
VTLARELGLLDSETRAKVRQAVQRRTRLEEQIERFDAWREARIRQVSDGYYALERAAINAHRVLQRWPDHEQAWDALARF